MSEVLKDIPDQTIYKVYKYLEFDPLVESSEPSEELTQEVIKFSNSNPEAFELLQEEHSICSDLGDKIKTKEPLICSVPECGSPIRWLIHSSQEVLDALLEAFEPEEIYLSCERCVIWNKSYSSIRLPYWPYIPPVSKFDGIKDWFKDLKAGRITYHMGRPKGWNTWKKQRSYRDKIPYY